MRIEQFPYSADNLGYVVYGSHSALVIDGGAVDAILEFIRNRQLRLVHVTHTHDHPDHTCGTPDLLKRSQAVFLDGDYWRHHSEISLDGESVQVYATPGHTTDSVTFHADSCLITGDTLFNGTVGNCFSGDLKAFYTSIKFLMTFPPDTLVYAGHDYQEYAMSFARLFESDNPHIAGYLSAYSPHHVCSSLKDEMRVNPYLRFNDSRFIRILEQKGLAVSTEFERWCSIMNLG